MEKSMGEYTIIHHYATTEEDFLKHQAELIADILYEELEPNEIEAIKNLYTKEKKANLTLKLDDEQEK